MKTYNLYNLKHYSKTGTLKILLFIVIIFLLSNVNAFVDFLLHPEIPFFDQEHLIVGTITGLFSLLLAAIIQISIIRLKKIDTERNILLKELVKAKVKAVESNRLKSAFLANMSHEIRTPMNGILGFVGLLDNLELTCEQQQQYIKTIEKSGIRMLNIVNNIIDISKIDAGLMEVRIMGSDINEQIEYIYNFFKPEADGKGIQLHFKNALPAKEAIIKTDREKLYAILTNLVKNAIKNTIKGSIEFGYILKTYHETEVLEFYVKDTGMGIPRHSQKTIFERFVQANTINTMATQGAGLGLAITKSYIEMLGGKIWVESEEGIGSCFYFTLPYNVMPEEKVPIENIGFLTTENLVKNLKILLVEDDETSETLLLMIVQMFCKEILKARNGIEAINACHDHPDIDLVLMDIQLPEINGFEASRQIRLLNKDVVIIAQTAYGLSGDREKAIESGCNDYISKPINYESLIGLIMKYFSK
jgi:signal transduction histidine kinase